MKKGLLHVLGLIGFIFVSNAQELIIGEERIKPGIIFIFEGAIKDNVSPNSFHLEENQTNVHIEARVNWDTQNVPKGTPLGGFIPYLHITAQIINEKTSLSTFVDLTAHINLIDNFSEIGFWPQNQDFEVLNAAQYSQIPYQGFARHPGRF